MTVLLVLVAVAQQRHPTPVRQLFDQPEGELLAMVLDGPVSLIHRTIGESVRYRRLNSAQVIPPARNALSNSSLGPRSAIHTS